ncbi:TPA: MOSC domain-containing protein, partial [Haemophilus influenzae]
DSFNELNALLNKDFSYMDTATYGENFVVSGLNEDNVCIGDRYQIGSTILEVSQPRKPCERLSKNTENEDARDIIYQTGLSGWYVRIIETGTIKQKDELKLLARPYPQITIRHLNRLLSAPKNEAELDAALEIEVLAEAFKRSIRSQISKFKQQG